MTLYSHEGKAFHFNIFLYVFPYSKLKYIWPWSLNVSKTTLFKCLNDAFEYCGGVPNEIWFDNMKQVVNHKKSDFGHAVFNERFKQFSQDAGYQPIACRVFRPQTKGVFESLSRTVERLRVYNHKFGDVVELINLIDDFREDLNHEVSQATEYHAKCGQTKKKSTSTNCQLTYLILSSKKTLPVPYQNNQWLTFGSVSIHWIHAISVIPLI